MVFAASSLTLPLTSPQQSSTRLSLQFSQVGDYSPNFKVHSLHFMKGKLKTEIGSTQMWQNHTSNTNKMNKFLCEKCEEKLDKKVTFDSTFGVMVDFPPCISLIISLGKKGRSKIYDK